MSKYWVTVLENERDNFEKIVENDIGAYSSEIIEGSNPPCCKIYPLVFSRWIRDPAIYLENLAYAGVINCWGTNEEGSSMDKEYEAQGRSKEEYLFLCEGKLYLDAELPLDKEVIIKQVNPTLSDVVRIYNDSMEDIRFDVPNHC